MDEEEEEDKKYEEEVKHETAVITPQLIEKSKQERLKGPKSETPTNDEEETEEERDDFNEDEIKQAFSQPPLKPMTDSASATFGEFEDEEVTKVSEEPEEVQSGDTNIFGIKTKEDEGWDVTAKFTGPLV